MVEESKPRALIVDDSKTARVVLRKMLDKHSYSVDMLESGEEALSYLERQTPDVIFMDHMMPGMDGFQAVKAIKSNTEHARIPIVMYTSKEGEVYVGQARALGAADILSKPAEAKELEAVLRRVNPPAPVPADEPVAEEAAPPQAAQTIEMPAVQLQDHAPPAPQSVEPSPQETVAAAGANPTAEAAPTAQEPPAGEPSEAGPPPYAGFPLHRGGAWGWVVPGLMLVAVLIFAGLYFQAEDARQKLARQQLALYESIEWALNQGGTYPYGETALGGKRLEMLQGLISQLAAVGYRGEVLLESHVGEFCLVTDELGIWDVAPPSLPITECEVIGQSSMQSQMLSAQQSIEFSEFLANTPLLGNTGISVKLVPLGASQPLFDYPADNVETAGEWNRVARRNNRVRVLLRPRGPTAAPLEQMALNAASE